MDDDLRQQIAALFRSAPGEELLGDQTPGEIADAVLAVRDTELENARAQIARVREVHDVHSCDRDGHIHRSTPNPCVNDGVCSCGQRSPCQTLAALDSPKDATDAAL